MLWIKHANDFGSVADRVGTRFGLGITIGAVIATATFLVGFFGVGRNVDRLVELGDEVAASGEEATPEQQARMDRAGASLERFGKMDLTFLMLALIAMATARTGRRRVAAREHRQWSSAMSRCVTSPGFFPMMIIARTSSTVTSSLFTVPTSLPCSITLIRSARS